MEKIILSNDLFVTDKEWKKFQKLSSLGKTEIKFEVKRTIQKASDVYHSIEFKVLEIN